MRFRVTALVRGFPISAVAVVLAIGMAVGVLAHRTYERTRECGQVRTGNVLAVQNVVLGIETELPAATVRPQDGSFEPCRDGKIYYRAAFDPSQREAVETWFREEIAHGWTVEPKADLPCAEKKIDGIEIGLQVESQPDKVVVAAAAEPGDDQPCRGYVDYFQGE